MPTDTSDYPCLVRFRVRNRRQGLLSDVLDGAGETLVLLGIVVLEADLEVDRLDELARLALLGGLEHLLDALVEGLLRNLGAGEKENLVKP